MKHFESTEIVNSWSNQFILEQINRPTR